MILSVNQISKKYKNGVVALDNVSLEFKQGIFGLLGPNGAGKSTLLRTIATLQKPDSGSVKLDDADIYQHSEDYKSRLGYLPQDFGLYPSVSAERLLDYLALLKGINNKNNRKEIVNYLLEKTNLHHYRKKNLGSYSGGMKQRFGIAQALLNNPSILVIDEPTTGLDPIEKDRFYNLLCSMAQEKIIILSTHIVDDIEELCSEMAIINQGKLVLTNTPKNSISMIEGKIWQKTINPTELDFYQCEYKVISEKFLYGSLTIHIYAEKLPDSSFIPSDPNLKDLYFNTIL
jgi:ABC-2 type transport system ATP-binding protein